MPDKVKVYCQTCEKEYIIPFNETSDLFGLKCKKCGSDDISYRDFIYEIEPDSTPLRMGERGCGTSGRFK